MSMATKHPLQQGLGNAFLHGESFSVGLPIEMESDRPLVMAHPAAGAHYYASFGLLADGGHPFIQVMADFGEATPDTWGYYAQEAGMATYQRLPDSAHGHKVYRKVGLATPHWQVHIQGDAYSHLKHLPPVDVLYVDWLEWLENHAQGTPPNRFANLVSAYVHHIREGGLVVLDHKHLFGPPALHPWFNCMHEAVVELTNGSRLESLGTLEWLAPNLNGEFNEHTATVFKVVHADAGLGEVDWDEAILPWLMLTTPEASLTSDDVSALLASNAPPPVHADAETMDQWMEEWMRYKELPENTFCSLGPMPAAHPWPQGAYARFLRWLLDHPDWLTDELKVRKYAMLGEAFTLNVVHGDLSRIAGRLHSPHSVLALRTGLAAKVVSRFPQWNHQVLSLQSPMPWMANPITGLTWSGANATPGLATTMLALAKSQPYDSLVPTVKSMQVSHLVTVAHGEASLGELMKDIKAHFDGLPPEMGRTPMQLTVVHLDASDYTDTDAIPWYFQFLPDDGLWGG